MDLQQALQMVEKLATRSYSAEELSQLLDFLRSTTKEETELLLSAYYQALSNRKDYEAVNPDLIQWVKNQAIHGERPAKIIDMPGRSNWLRPVVAVAVILFLLVGGIIYWSAMRKSAKIEPAIAKTQPDIDPGGDKAMLTLADGSKIALDSAGNGVLARQGSTKVIKVDAGRLAYNTNPQKLSVPLYNTISTPKGGQYQVVLPDGTHVWLNAASSLTFPTAFQGSARSVRLTGEGYFEVAASKSIPFVVLTSESSIQVLGTHFDVSSYIDDSIESTTLLEGAVKVIKGATGIVLRPNEQAQIKPSGPPVAVMTSDAERAIAWKNGMFDFEHLGLFAAMRQVSRWYDVEVIYEGRVPDKSLFGSLHRDTKLSTILNLLRRIDVHCRMEGRKVYISP